MFTLPTVTTHAQTTAFEAEAEAARVRYDTRMREALQAYSSGQFEEARVAMQAAHQLSPNARTLRGLGMIAFELGDFAEARRHLGAALEDEHKPLTPDQRIAVHELLASAEAKLGRYHLQVPEDWMDPRVQVDGEARELGYERDVWLEAGAHVLRLQADADHAFAWDVEVHGGEREVLEVQDAPHHAPPSAEDAAGAAPVESTRPFRAWGIGLGAAGGVLVASGLSLGGVALAKARSANSDVGAQADRAQALARASDVLSITGAAVAVVGLSLWLVRREAPASRQAWTLQPHPSRTGAGLLLSGRF